MDENGEMVLRLFGRQRNVVNNALAEYESALSKQKKKASEFGVPTDGYDTMLSIAAEIRDQIKPQIMDEPAPESHVVGEQPDLPFDEPPAKGGEVIDLTGGTIPGDERDGEERVEGDGGAFDSTDHAFDPTSDSQRPASDDPPEPWKDGLTNDDDIPD